MTCKKVNEFLAAYLDRTLPWRCRLLFGLHLLMCPHCRSYLASYAATIRLAQSLGQPLEPLATPVPRALVDAILAARHTKAESPSDGRSAPAG